MEDGILIKKAQEGSSEALEELIEKHSGLIWSIVKRFSGRGTETADLYQIGALGFIKCVKRFNTNFDVKLSTYAVPMILGEIKCFLRSDGMVKISRTLKENCIKLSALMEKEQLTLAQAAESLGISYENAVLALDAARGVESLDYTVDDENKISAVERITTGENEEDKLLDRLELERVLALLPEQSREIIKLRYFENKTQSYVAKKLGMSQVSVSRAEKKILGLMREKMG